MKKTYQFQLYSPDNNWRVSSYKLLLKKSKILYLLLNLENES